MTSGASPPSGGEAPVVSGRFARAQAPSELFLGLMETEPDTVTAMLATGLRLQLPAMSRFWRPYVESARRRGEVRADLDVAMASEWIFRMVLSVATVPGDTSGGAGVTP